MASAAISLLSYHFRSQEPIFSSKTSSSVSTGRRTFGSIKAAQVKSHENPRRRAQNVQGDIFVGKETSVFLSFFANRNTEQSITPSRSIFADNTCIDCDTCRWMVPVRLSCSKSVKLLSFGSYEIDQQLHGFVKI